jgi:hypothetical protein
LKTRTKHDGGCRQECAAAVWRPTRRTVPAMRKGGLRDLTWDRTRAAAVGSQRLIASYP